jgi:hypothetical protein
MASPPFSSASEAWPSDALQQPVNSNDELNRKITMQTLLKQLQRLEAELHHPGVHCSAERLEALLHPDFHEVGRSGIQYSRATVIAYLLSQGPQSTTESDQYAVHALSPDCALLTYRSAQRVQGGQESHAALRSSVWMRTADRWQLFYHQGTPTASLNALPGPPHAS